MDPLATPLSGEIPEKLGGVLCGLCESIDLSSEGLENSTATFWLEVESIRPPVFLPDG